MFAVIYEVPMRRTLEPDAARNSIVLKEEERKGSESTSVFELSISSCAVDWALNSFRIQFWQEALLIRFSVSWNWNAYLHFYIGKKGMKHLGIFRGHQVNAWNEQGYKICSRIHSISSVPPWQMLMSAPSLLSIIVNSSWKRGVMYVYGLFLSGALFQLKSWSK